MYNLIRNFLLIATVALILGSTMYAQSLKSVVSSNKAYGEETESVIELKANVQNISSTTKNVKIKLVMTSLAEGHQVTFCWGENCYPPKTTDFEMPNGEHEVIPANDSSLYGLKLDLVPNNVKGTSEIKIVYIVDGTPSDFTSFDAIFYAGVSAVNENEMFSMSVYPNPAASYLNVNLKQASDMNFNLIDINGNNVKSSLLKEGSNLINLLDLPNGEYIYSVSAQNKTFASHKLIIAR